MDPRPPAPAPYLALFAAGHRAFESGDLAGAIESLDDGLRAFDAAASPLPQFLRVGLFLDLAVWQGLVQAHLDLAHIYSLSLRPGAAPLPWDPRFEIPANLVFAHLIHVVACGMHRWETLDGAGFPPAITADSRWQRLREQMAGAAAALPPWLEAFHRAQLCEQRGDYRGRVKGYLDALAAWHSAWPALTNARKTEVATDPNFRRALADAYYHCACGLATCAAGDSSIVVDAGNATPETAAHHRDQAFDFLRRAREQGWHDFAKALSDPLLAILRDDPRWRALWGTWS